MRGGLIRNRRIRPRSLLETSKGSLSLVSSQRKAVGAQPSIGNAVKTSNLYDGNYVRDSHGIKGCEIRSMMFAIKAAVSDPRAKTFAFSTHKTMYGGKHIAKGDTIFIFASENEGGSGLIASGVVTSAKAIAKRHGITRQTPRVSITIRRTALAKRRIGRTELKPSSNWNDGRPETELNFKFYRQATNKIAGISEEAAAFLLRFF
jgi:hypothetical protein